VEAIQLSGRASGSQNQSGSEEAQESRKQRNRSADYGADANSAKWSDARTREGVEFRVGRKEAFDSWRAGGWRSCVMLSMSCSTRNHVIRNGEKYAIGP